MKSKNKTVYKNNNTEIKYNQLPINSLVSSQEYQKDRVDTKVVSSIIKSFNPHRLGTLRVSFRGGTYYVFDGQHRLTALKTMYPDGIYFVECEIHYGLTYEEEAKLFAEQNKNKSALTAYHEFNAKMEAKDNDAIEINRIITESGLAVARTNLGQQAGKVRCVKKIETIYKKHGGSMLYKIFCLINKTWNGDIYSLEARFVGGVYLFCVTYDKEIDNNKFIRVLGRVKPQEIIVIGKADISTSGDLRFARVIWQEYNRGSKENNRLPYKFKG